MSGTEANEMDEGELRGGALNKPVEPEKNNSRMLLKKALLRTHWVLCHPSFRVQHVMAWVHGQTYEGPIWPEQPEIAEALKIAGLPPELPMPSYPENEAGVFRKKYVERKVNNSVTITEHTWEEPAPEEAVFLGTWSECQEWVSKRGLSGSVIAVANHEDGASPSLRDSLYITKTGRIIDKGEEKAFFAQFGVEI